MAIVVLVLWMFTAGAGIYLLVTSSLGRSRPAVSPAATPVPHPPAATPVPHPAAATPVPHPAAATSVPHPAAATVPAPAAASASTAQPDPFPPTAQAAPSPREAKRAARDRWDPPSLVAARQAPILPSGRSLVEFAHPAGGLIGLGFWLGFTLVHNRALGWIAFGLAAATVCVGLGWFTANTRAARQAGPGHPTPSFAGRLVALHGSGAALTLALAALTALVLRS